MFCSFCSLKFARIEEELKAAAKTGLTVQDKELISSRIFYIGALF
jgi:hypothetical protein